MMIMRNDKASTFVVVSLYFLFAFPVNADLVTVRHVQVHSWIRRSEGFGRQDPCFGEVTQLPAENYVMTMIQPLLQKTGPSTRKRLYFQKAARFSCSAISKFRKVRVFKDVEHTSVETATST